MTAPTYEITAWEERYENHRSRILQNLSFVLIPNSHDGEAFAEIMAHPKASEIFTAWILMLQVASRCGNSPETRGKLIRQNGRPHDAESLALRTRARAEWFTTAIPVLVSLAWITANPQPANHTAPPGAPTPVPAAAAPPPAAPPPAAGEDLALETQGSGANSTPKEGKKEEKGMKEGPRPADTAAASTPAADPDQAWIQELATSGAYDGIDVPREFLRCKAWFMTKRKGVSRARFLNWMNRTERPMSGGSAPLL